MGTAVAGLVKDEFVNDSGGVQGVVIIDVDGKQRGIAVKPGDSIWLSQEEQILTANAPKQDADNPLTNGALRLTTEAQEIISRRPLRPAGDLPEAASVEELGEGATVTVETPAEVKEVATPVAQETEQASDTPPTEGSRPEGEEVATPDADEQGEGVEEIPALAHQGQPVRRAKRKE